MKLSESIITLLFMSALLIGSGCNSLKKCEDLPFPEIMKDSNRLNGELFVMYTLEKEIELTDSSKYGKRTGELMIKTYEFSTKPILDKIVEVSLMYVKYDSLEKKIYIGYLNPTRVERRWLAFKSKAGRDITRYNLCGSLVILPDSGFLLQLDGKKKKHVEFEGTLFPKGAKRPCEVNSAEFTHYCYQNNRFRRVVEKPPMTSIEQAYGKNSNFIYKNITDSLHFTMKDTLRTDASPIAWYRLNDSTRFVINNSKGKRIMRIEAVQP